MKTILGSQGIKVNRPKLLIYLPNSFDYSNYFYEPKLDGDRAIWFPNELWNRHGSRFSWKFWSKIREFEKRLKNVLPYSILDGELMIENGEGVYYIFDILSYENKLIIHLPTFQRKAILKEIIKETEEIRLMPFNEFTNRKDVLDYFNSLRPEKKVEGIVIKPKYQGYYAPWYKLKFSNSKWR